MSASPAGAGAPHRHSIAQIEDITKSRRNRTRPARAASIALPDNGSHAQQSHLLGLLDKQPTLPPKDAERPRPKPTIPATPPPVPMRAPAVPKRTYVPPTATASQRPIDTTCRNHPSAAQPLLPKPAGPKPPQPAAPAQYLPPIPPPTSRPRRHTDADKLEELPKQIGALKNHNIKTYTTTNVPQQNTEFRNKIPPPPTGPPPNVPNVPVAPKSPKVNNVPPPLCHVPAGNIQKSASNSKISMRQDSSVSSDSFSQTSSPSYTTKTMETPLLPHMSGGSSAVARVLCNGKAGGDKTGAGRSGSTVATMLARKRQSESEMKDMNGNGALTKSASTPASLQTIVRFHNGSNMSLHHRIIRDMRRPSSHYVSRIRLRFRLAQVVVNAIALLAIGDGLAAYFKAYPTAVQVVNNSMPAVPAAAVGSVGVNPAPGICLPVIVSFCQYHKELEVYDAVVDVRCYELAALFLCSVFVPKCGPTGQVVRPCQKLCSETKRRCGFFLDVFGLALPDYLECSLFPDSPDPNVCVGHHEVNEAEKRAQKPVCPSGFQCDVKRCIPRDWKCDGHVDCEDQSDELNCEECSSKGMIHCGDKRCMAQEHLCDGKVDCPLAQDERNCMRLSEKNGDEGRGQLQVYLPEHKKFMPACVTPGWNQSTSPVYICNLLGYSTSNGSRLIGATDKNISPPVYDMQTSPNKSKKNLMKELGSCKSKSYTTVDLTCTNYICGKIRKSYAERATMRIVGGTPSKPGDWPFLAALLGGPEEVFYCAGVLIADQWVLTASHCVGNHSDVTGWTIQLGITRRHAHSYFGQKMKVRRVVPHPMYNLGVAHDNDIALFQLASPVTFHEHLLPVCLPPDDKELRPGINCTVIGWGKKEDKDMSEYEPAVNEVEVPVLDRDLCNTWLENRDLNVTDGMICAGFKEGGKDACQCAPAGSNAM